MGRRAERDRRIEREVDAEVRFHLESRVEDLRAAGLSEAAARARAVEEFGNVDDVRTELTRIDARRAGRQRRRAPLEHLRVELRRGLRTLIRERGFSLLAVLTLSLGLGAAVAIFTLLDAIVLRPLPYDSPGELVRLSSPVPGVGPDVRWALAKGEFLYFRSQARTFESLGLYRTASVVVGAEGDGAERVLAVQVEPGVADVLRIGMRHGRFVGSEDNLDAVGSVAVLSHAYFVRRFAGDASVVGRTIRVDGVSREVIGVLEPDVRLPEEIASSRRIDLWLPLQLDPAEPARPSHLYPSIGRLRDGVGLTRAQAELTRLTERLPQALPQAYSSAFFERTGFRTEVEPLREYVLGSAARALWMLLAAVALVLLIALANVANLFLVRAESQRRDAAVRIALGAGRGHLFMGGAVEGTWLAIAAGALGCALAALVVRVVVLLAPAGLPRLDSAALGLRGVGFTILLGLITMLVLACVRLLRGRPDVAMLRGEGRGHTESRRGRTARGALVVTQFALALVLLTGAGLLLRSYAKLRQVEPGFEPAGLISVSVHLPATARYDAWQGAGGFYRELQDRVRALPGVERAGLTEYLPFGGGIGCTIVFVDASGVSGNGPPCVPVLVTGPDYFATMGVPVTGEEPQWPEVLAGRAGAVVSRALAERLWPGADPIGRGIRPNNPNGPLYRVVGVAGDVRDGLDRPPLEAVYFPIVPNPEALVSIGPPHGMDLVIRAPDRGASIASAVRAILAELDAGVAVGAVEEVDRLVARSMARTTFSALLLLVAALLSMALSAVGIYGVIAYAVRQRRMEIGLRIALGAPVERVTALVVGESLRLAGAGIAIGLGGAIGVGRLLRAQLFEVEPLDPTVIAAAAAVLLVVSLAASAWPARYAAGLDPAHTLQSR